MNENNNPVLLLGAEATAKSLGISRAGFYSLHSAGKVPAPRRLGRRVLWSVEEMRAWVNAGMPSREKWQIKTPQVTP